MGVRKKVGEINQKMGLSIDALTKEFAGVRAGRASAALLEPVKIDAYGALMPLTQVGTVSAADPRVLVVSVWDSGLVRAVEKAIRDCGGNFNPMIDGQSVRVPIPALSEERRAELAKLTAKYAEETKIALRNIRKEGMNLIKNLEKNNEINEDEMHELSAEIEVLTKNSSATVVTMLANKQKDITKI